jgi:hypothetical protein
VAEIALKTLTSDKKAKIATPSGQTTTGVLIPLLRFPVNLIMHVVSRTVIAKPAFTSGDKEVPHVATPHPSKQASKTSGNSKSKAKSPKSVGTHACKSCSKYADVLRN